MTRLVHAAAIAGLLVAAAGARAQEDADAGWQVEGTVPVEVIGGHTTYTIWGADAASSFRSELRFPLQGVMAGVRVRLLAPRGDDGARWVFEGAGLHTLTEQTGTMEDSDWIDGAAETAPPPDGEGLAPHPGKDIYSTSKAFLRAYTLEARASWQHDVTRSLRLAPLAGLLYQSFSYVVVDVNQVGYGSWAPIVTGSVGGRVLTYDAGYRAVYLGARGELSVGQLTAALDAWYSPFARASDEDDHLLRGKVSRTDADGTAWQVRGEGRLSLSPADALSLQVGLLGFRVTGTQSQTFSDGTLIRGIDAKLTSLRWNAGLAYTRRFR
jgi:outer membrane protease